MRLLLTLSESKHNSIFSTTFMSIVNLLNKTGHFPGHQVCFTDTEGDQYFSNENYLFAFITVVNHHKLKTVQFKLSDQNAGKSWKLSVFFFK